MTTGPHAHLVVPGRTRRLTLWRDASALLFGVVAIVLLAQLTINGNGRNAAGGAPTERVAGATDATNGATRTRTPAADVSIGPVVDPSLIPALLATATPSSTATAGPTRKPAASPARTLTPTPSPGTTSSPSPLPTLGPSPTDTPTPTATPTPAPLPVAALGCSVLSGTSTVTCQNLSHDAVSYIWDFGDGTMDTAATPPDHTYAADGTYTISLTATNGDGASDTASTDVTVPAP